MSKKAKAKSRKKVTAKKIIKKALPPRKEHPHRAIFALSPKVLMSLFSGRHHFEVVQNPLPPDAKILDVRLDKWNGGQDGAIEILLEHPAIPELIEGQPIPHVKPPAFRSIPDAK